MRFPPALFTALLATLPFATQGHPGLGDSGGLPCPAAGGPSSKNAVFRSLNTRMGDGGIPEGGFEAVMADLRVALTDSQDFFPADFEPPIGPSYVGLFIRLAWHCAGSYRRSDGRGGCDGGRIRFDPEINWPDNASLDMALLLLTPIKEKFGESLSWGDLIILSGNVAIEAAGGPIIGFCGGRIDDADGSDSLRLGPSDEQEAIAPCLSLGQQGLCQDVDDTPLGPTTVGLIYVNPAGPVDDTGNALASAEDVRATFTQMGMNDTETVALVGGGHAFGKCHGDPATLVTSGFEGPWTTTPTTWDNQYFKNLFDYRWEETQSPAGELQLEPFNFTTGNPGPPIIMLVADIALRDDPIYTELSQMYRRSLEGLSASFGAAWYKLTSQDMGPSNRCIGSMVPPQQPFQFDLPEADLPLPDYVPVRSAIQAVIDADSSASDMLINLAFRCASTFRKTDFRGGCNGARIRFSPEADWEVNAFADEALDLLDPVNTAYPSVPYADLIVLAGITALESETSGLDLPFCGGYVDATDGLGSVGLGPRIYATPLITFNDLLLVQGLTKEEGVVLLARENVSADYFRGILENGDSNDEEEAVLMSEQYTDIVEMFASDDDLVKTSFAAAWTKFMTADRFGDFRENACTGVSTPTIGAPAPVTAPVPAPVPAPVTAPVPAPVPAPVAGCAITGFTIYDSEKNMQALTEGTRICSSNPHELYNIAATAPGCSTVVLELDGGNNRFSSSRTERVSPYFLFGDDAGVPDLESVPDGSYEVEARGDGGDSVYVSFSLNVGC